MATVVYRGPLQRSRLGFILESATTAYGSAELVWLVPRNVDLSDHAVAQRFKKFIDAHEKVTAVHTLDGGIKAAPSAVRNLRGLLARDGGPVVCMGYTSVWYGRAAARGPLTWCVSGIPEERLLYDDSMKSRASVNAMWRAVGLVRKPELVVTVSNPMSALVQRRLGDVSCFAAPTCPDRELFRPRKEHERRYLTYLGTGAPWQGLSQLAGVWAEIARRRPETRFRVISRDERTRVLGEGVPPESIEFTPAQGPREVAELLWEASAGFIIRSPHVVNDVSYPTKFGEYVAAGVPVVATDLEWDLSQVIRDTGCGVLVPVNANGDAADAVLSLGGGELPQACEQAADRLDRRKWVRQLADALPN